MILLSSADPIAAALGPTGSGRNTVSAEGVEAPKLLPNSTAPSDVPGLSVLMSSLRPLTRSVPESVPAIEPESSMIASMLVAGVHALALACARETLAPLGAAMAATIIPAAAVADSAYVRRFIGLCLPVRYRFEDPNCPLLTGQRPWT